MKGEIRMEGKNINYKIGCQKGLYLYARCQEKGCKAHMRFKVQEEGFFRLTKISPKHLHFIPSSRSLKFRAVREYFKSLPDCLSLSTLKHLVCRQFTISSKQFYYNYRLSKNPPLSFADLTSQFESQGYELFFSTE